MLAFLFQDLFFYSLLFRLRLLLNSLSFLFRVLEPFWLLTKDILQVLLVIIQGWRTQAAFASRILFHERFY